MQHGLPLFFRKISKHEFNRTGLDNIIREILKKTSDLKMKLRVASKNMCIYLSHQSPIGPEKMADHTLDFLTGMIEKSSLDLNSKPVKASSIAVTKPDEVESSLCNSTMWTSCVSLLIEYQRQASLAATSTSDYTAKFMHIINCSLRHHTPSVRKEAELLFIELYKTIGHKLEPLLVDQKQSLVDRLIKEAKIQSGISVKTDAEELEEKKAKDNYISNKIKSDYLPESLTKIFGQENLDYLKATNPKKRLKGLVEIKKIFSKFTVNFNEKKAKELSDPITHLMRQILSDESTNVYLESLKVVRYFIAALAPHLGTLDLHILIGSFIGIIVSNTVSSNVRIQVASDKVIIFFAKHNNIGPFVVARDIIKNIEKISFAVEKAGSKKKETFANKKLFLTRFLSILLLLVNQFSIVLCYEADFNDKMIACLAQLIDNSDSDPNIKSLVSQTLSTLHSIDSKTLEVSINALDPIKKAPLKKIMIELEAQRKSGKSVITQSKTSFTNSDMSSHTPPFRLSPSGRDSSSRTSLFSGGSQAYNVNRQSTNDENEGLRSSDGFKSELRSSRRLLQKQGSGMDYSASKPSNAPMAGQITMNRNMTERKPQVGLIRRAQQSLDATGISKFVLPEVKPKGSNVLPPIAGTTPGIAMTSSYEPSAFTTAQTQPRRTGRTHKDHPFADSLNKPPLYQKQSETLREGAKFTDDSFGPGRYSTVSHTQKDFNPKELMGSNSGLGSNYKTKESVPQATYEFATINYEASKKPKKDILDLEAKKYNF